MIMLQQRWLQLSENNNQGPGRILRLSEIKGRAGARQTKREGERGADFMEMIMGECVSSSQEVACSKNSYSTLQADRGRMQKERYTLSVGAALTD